MRIDESPYHSSFFYKLNFVWRRQFFIILKNTSKNAKKYEMTHFRTRKSIKGGHFSQLKTISLKTCSLTRACISFRSSYRKVHFVPQVRHLRDGFNVMCDFAFTSGEERDYTDDTKVIMLVGATGSGKSTLVDGMVNYITDVAFEDHFRFSLIDLTKEEEVKDGDQVI